MGFDDAGGCAQSQAGFGGMGGCFAEKRFEDVFQGVSIHAAAGVGDGNHDVIAASVDGTALCRGLVV